MQMDTALVSSVRHEPKTRLTSKALTLLTYVLSDRMKLSPSLLLHRVDTSMTPKKMQSNLYYGVPRRYASTQMHPTPAPEYVVDTNSQMDGRAMPHTFITGLCLRTATPSLIYVLSTPTPSLSYLRLSFPVINGSSRMPLASMRHVFQIR